MSMKALWVIQENLNRDDRNLIPVLEDLKQPFKLISIIPFSDELPTVEWDGPIIARGSTTTLRNVERSSWKPGVWHNEFFKPSHYKANYRDLYLNKDSWVGPLREAPARWANSREIKFVRPNSDYKEFTGWMQTRREINKFLKGAQQQTYPYDENLEVLVAEPINIENEYRCVVVNRKVVSGYSYRLNRRLKNLPAPDKVKEFAQKAADIWGPADVYSLDVGQKRNGELGIVECNCFNSSGIYGDSKTIVTEITKFVESRS